MKRQRSLSADQSHDDNGSIEASTTIKQACTFCKKNVANLQRHQRSCPMMNFLVRQHCQGQQNTNPMAVAPSSIFPACPVCDTVFANDVRRLLHITEFHQGHRMALKPLCFKIKFHETVINGEHFMTALDPAETTSPPDIFSDEGIHTSAASVVSEVRGEQSELSTVFTREENASDAQTPSSDVEKVNVKKNHNPGSSMAMSPYSEAIVSTDKEFRDSQPSTSKASSPTATKERFSEDDKLCCRLISAGANQAFKFYSGSIAGGLTANVIVHAASGVRKSPAHCLRMKHVFSLDELPCYTKKAFYLVLRTENEPKREILIFAFFVQEFDSVFESQRCLAGRRTIVTHFNSPGCIPSYLYRIVCRQFWLDYLSYLKSNGFESVFISKKAFDTRAITTDDDVNFFNCPADSHDNLLSIDGDELMWSIFNEAKARLYVEQVYDEVYDYIESKQVADAKEVLFKCFVDHNDWKAGIEEGLVDETAGQRADEIVLGAIKSKLVGYVVLELTPLANSNRDGLIVLNSAFPNDEADLRGNCLRNELHFEDISSIIPATAAILKDQQH